MTAPAVDPRALESFGEQLADPHYLGNVACVTGLVSDFCEQLYSWMKEVAARRMSIAQLRPKLDRELRRRGSIVMGRDEDYRAISGWNRAEGVGIALKQFLGPWWEKYHGTVHEDPGVGVFAWLASNLIEQAILSQANAGADPDLAGLQMRQRMNDVVRVLLGVHRRG